MQALTAKKRAKNDLTEKCAKCGETMEDVMSGRSIEYTVSQQAGFRLQASGQWKKVRFCIHVPQAQAIGRVRQGFVHRPGSQLQGAYSHERVDLQG